MTTIQMRRGPAAQWTSVNPVLNPGEFGVELDTFKVKTGDGATAWSMLPYVGSSGASLLINVKDYGAQGDGSTDDTAAIASAIAVAGAAITPTNPWAQSATVFFPAGVYVTGPLTLPQRVGLERRRLWHDAATESQRRRVGEPDHEPAELCGRQ